MQFFDETPGMGTLRNLLYAIIITSLYAVSTLFMGRFNTGFFPAYLLTGICLSFFGWGGERLWYATMYSFFKKPFAWHAALTHIPLWAMFGGMGYSTALLIAKKYCMVPVDDIPVKNIFFTGAALGCIFQFILYLLDIRIKQSHTTFHKV